MTGLLTAVHGIQVADADVLIPTTGLVDAQAIRSAKKLKLIVQPASGYSNISIETASELGIPVCHSPGFVPLTCHALRQPGSAISRTQTPLEYTRS